LSMLLIIFCPIYLHLAPQSLDKLQSPSRGECPSLHDGHGTDSSHLGFSNHGRADGVKGRHRETATEERGTGKSRQGGKQHRQHANRKRDGRSKSSVEQRN
jgi:hypothetical protein